MCSFLGAQWCFYSSNFAVTFAHLNFLTLLRPDENEAFEYGIITPSPALKYRQNLIPFTWNSTE